VLFIILVQCPRPYYLFCCCHSWSYLCNHQEFWEGKLWPQIKTYSLCYLCYFYIVSDILTWWHIAYGWVVLKCVTLGSVFCPYIEPLSNIYSFQSGIRLLQYCIYCTYYQYWIWRLQFISVLMDHSLITLNSRICIEFCSMIVFLTLSVRVLSIVSFYCWYNMLNYLLCPSVEIFMYL
jgi:hypothetical protein